MGHPVFKSLASSLQKKRDCSPSKSFGDCHGKRTWVDSPEVKVGSEHSPTWGGNYMPDVTPDTGTSSALPRQGSSSPTRANPDDGTAAGSSKSIGDQTSSDSGSTRGNMADFNLDTASGDCLSCSDTDEVSIQTAQKRYRKRVRVSCKLSKGSDCMEAQLKRIGDCHWDNWGHDLATVKSERKHALAEDQDSFENAKDDGQN